MFTTDKEIEASIAHLESIKAAMRDGKIARNEAEMKGNLPKLMFSERTADELLEAVETIKALRQANNELSAKSKRYQKALGKIVCLNIPMPDEVFQIANGALEEWVVK